MNDCVKTKCERDTESLRRLEMSQGTDHRRVKLETLKEKTRSVGVQSAGLRLAGSGLGFLLVRFFQVNWVSHFLRF